MNDLARQLLAIAHPTATATATALAPAPAVAIQQVDLALPLFEFQREAVEHALRDNDKPYAYIALDMGLGKTPCGIAVAASAAAAGVRPTLVVCPPSLRYNWAAEFARFAPWLKTATIRSATPDPDEAIPAHIDVLILGDSTLAGWVDFLTGKVGALVVDEAHRFKNPSGRSAALVQLATGIKHVKQTKTTRGQKITLASGAALPRLRVLMSGTPTPNGRHAELAAQIDVLGNPAWSDIGGKGTFWHHYAPQVDRWGTRTSADGAGLYNAMSNTWYHRRLRGDVIDLPAKGRASVTLEGKGAAVRRYKKAHDDIVAFLAAKQDGKVSDGQVRAQALIKLGTLRHLAGLCKVESIVSYGSELLDDSSSGVFIVAEHTDVIDGLMAGFRKYKPVAVQGGMTDEQKQDAVEAFITGESRVLVGQITAAGVGLTLHGGGLNHHVIVAQLPWTPADLKQAEDRLHRIGQTNDVTVDVTLCHIEGTLTIDERLWGMLEAKNAASTTITDGTAEFLLSDLQDNILDSYR